MAFWNRSQSSFPNGDFHRSPGQAMASGSESLRRPGLAGTRDPCGRARSAEFSRRRAEAESIRGPMRPRHSAAKCNAVCSADLHDHNPNPVIVGWAPPTESNRMQRWAVPTLLSSPDLTLGYGVVPFQGNPSARIGTTSYRCLLHLRISSTEVITWTILRNCSRGSGPSFRTSIFRIAKLSRRKLDQTPAFANAEVVSEQCLSKFGGLVSGMFMIATVCERRGAVVGFSRPNVCHQL